MSEERADARDLELPLEPERRDGGVVVLDVEGIPLTLTPRGSGWDYDRPGLARPIHVAESAGRLPRVRVRVADDEAVARFTYPVFLPGSEAVDLWVAWPLEVAVVVGEDDELDCLSPGRRQTLFGTVSEGRVLPAAVCAALTGPEDPAVSGRPLAALQVRVRNHGPDPVTVSRVPVFGGSLALHRRGASFAVGLARADITVGGNAEATTKPSDPPPGFSRVAGPRVAQHGSNLGWLLDATRRSVEFPL